MPRVQRARARRRGRTSYRAANVSTRHPGSRGAAETGRDLPRGPWLAADPGSSRWRAPVGMTGGNFRPTVSFGRTGEGGLLCTMEKAPSSGLPPPSPQGEKELSHRFGGLLGWDRRVALAERQLHDDAV